MKKLAYAQGITDKEQTEEDINQFMAYDEEEA